MDSARQVIELILNPRVSSYQTSHDVSSSVNQSLG